MIGTRFTDLAREIWASAIAQRTQSLLTLLVAAAMTLTVMLTVGSTVGARQQIVASIDDAGTRTIVVRAQESSGLSTRVLDRLETIDGIEWSGGLGRVEDVYPAGLPGSTPVPHRVLYAEDWTSFSIGPHDAVGPDEAWATPRTLDQLGFPDGVGAVESLRGTALTVRGPAEVPENMAFLDPIVLSSPDDEQRPRDAADSASDDAEPLSILVVVASTPADVGPLVDLLPGLMALDDPSQAEMSTSEAFADLRNSIDAQLSSFSRSLLLLTFGSGALLVGITQAASVMLRRKDYGRRRALGATQGLIVVLMMGQTLLVTAVGALLGLGASFLVLLRMDSPWPGFAFSTALAVLIVASAVIAAVIPAVIAARRDPLTELRVP